MIWLLCIGMAWFLLLAVVTAFVANEQIKKMRCCGNCRWNYVEPIDVYTVHCRRVVGLDSKKSGKGYCCGWREMMVPR